MSIDGSNHSQWPERELWLDLPKLQMALVLLGGSWLLRKQSEEQLQLTQTEPPDSAVEVEDQTPCPASFTAATRNTYDVPFVSSVTVAPVEEAVASMNVVQEDPALDEYWTM
jgi:hypothetical protein